MSFQLKSPVPFARQYPRFKVSHWKEIIGSLDRNRSNEQLVMIGNGGCGFYGFQPGFPARYPHRVFCEFSLRGEDYKDFPKIIAQGNIIYSTPIHLGSLKVFFHGVEFIPSERLKLRPLISILEKLHDLNKIELT
jgi:hypothetical protein